MCYMGFSYLTNLKNEMQAWLSPVIAVSVLRFALPRAGILRRLPPLDTPSFSYLRLCRGRL